MATRRAPLVCIAALLWGCGGAESPEVPEPAAAAVSADGPKVTLDGVSLGSARAPGTLPARLADTLPAGAPSWDTLAEVRVVGPTGQKLFFAHPGARPRPQDLAWVMHNGSPAVGLVDLPPEGASDALRVAMATPSRIVPAPTAIQLYTVRPEAEAATWPVLQVAVDADGAGRIRQDEVVGLPTLVEPGREGATGAVEHAPGWALGAVVALRVPLVEVATVELSGGSGPPISISGADLRAGPVLQLKVTRKGAWNLKRFDGGATTPTLVARDLDQLTIVRSPGG